MPLSECQRISAWARDYGIIMHLNGAGMLQEYAHCFNSLSICFSKGLGAPIGGIFVGTRSLIKHARWIVHRRVLRQAGVVMAAARVAVDDTFLGGKLKPRTTLHPGWVERIFFVVAVIKTGTKAMQVSSIVF